MIIGSNQHHSAAQHSFFVFAKGFHVSMSASSRSTPGLAEVALPFWRTLAGIGLVVGNVFHRPVCLRALAKSASNGSNSGGSRHAGKFQVSQGRSAPKGSYSGGRHCATGPARWFMGELIGLFLGVRLLQIPGKKKHHAVADAALQTIEPISTAPAKAARSSSNKRWQSCNVLQVGAETRRLWNFGTGKGGFNLAGEQAVPAATPLPLNLVGRDWKVLFQPRLNISLAAGRAGVLACRAVTHQRVR